MVEMLYKDLLQKYGDPSKIWPQWCAKEKDLHTRELIVIGAVLTQRTSWRNAEIALKNLAKAGLLGLEKISRQSNLNKLTELTRVAGFYTTKPKRLYELATFIVRSGGIESLLNRETKRFRSELLEVYGIGPETADTILLYVFDKPSFIIDEYTKRFSIKYGLTDGLGYYELKELFESTLPKDTKVYQNYHTLIIVDQKGIEGSKMRIVI